MRYAGKEALSIRTKDNNTVTVDVSVPYRIKPDRAFQVMKAGNHLSMGNRMRRFQRLANDTTISVLRENLAQLQSRDFYNTQRRLQVAQRTLKALNSALDKLHLEASGVLIRAAYFRDQYERQLAQIQLNEQQKLLDGAKKRVSDEQQKLDNYAQRTEALGSAREQDWKRRIADLDRAYQVGFISTEDRSPGAARRLLKAMSKQQREKLVASAEAVFAAASGSLPRSTDDSPPGKPVAVATNKEDTLVKVTDAHLLGIKNIEAETTEYRSRVRSAADGISGRLAAEGLAKVAEVKGAYEARVNQLLNSPAGRAYVAYRAAQNVHFAETLTFQSSEGIPAILRLRDFAVKFMGR